MTRIEKRALPSSHRGGERGRLTLVAFHKVAVRTKLHAAHAIRDGTPHLPELARAVLGWPHLTAVQPRQLVDNPFPLLHFCVDWTLIIFEICGPLIMQTAQPKAITTKHLFAVCVFVVFLQTLSISVSVVSVLWLLLLLLAAKAICGPVKLSSVFDRLASHVSLCYDCFAIGHWFQTE